jgi:putative PEP-CTERM system TPR-repeat lipoprotein
MKRILLASAVILIAAVGGGGWYVLASRDPVQTAKTLLSKGDYAGANLQLRNAVRDQPNNPEAHALLAQLRLSAGDPIAAEHEIKSAMALHWDQASSLALLGQAYMRQQKWQDILTDIPEQGASSEQTAYFLMTRAVAQRGLKDNAKASATIAQAEHLAPQNAEVHLVAARFAAQDGQREQAMNEVDRSLAIEPNGSDALRIKAGLLAAKGDRDGALAALNRAVQASPDNVDLRIEHAGLLLFVNKDAEAASEIEAVLKRQPKNGIALYVKTVLLIRQQKYAEADLLLQQLDPFISQFQRGFYFKAMVKAQTGQNGQAEDAAMSYVNRFPNDADGIRLLAAIELSTNHANRAVPYLQRAVAAGQKDAETLNLLGRAYAAEGKQADAEQAFQQAAQNATTPDQFARLASARLQVGDLTGAAAALQRTVDAAPSESAAGEALVATAIRLGELDRAQDALDKLHQQEGDSEAVGNLTGLLKLARLDAQGALAAFEDTVKRFPDSIGARLNEAKLLLQLHRGSEALPILQTILDKDPAQIETLTLLAQTLVAQNRGEEALAAAERARKAKPDDLGIINGEAQIYARLRQYDKAIEVLNSAKTNDKMPTQLLATLGSVQLAAGQTDAAKQTFAALIAADPNNIGVILSDVEVLNRLKDFDGARSVLDDAITRQPTSLPLLQSRARVDLLDKGPDAALQTAERLRSDNAHMPAAATLKGGLLMGAQRYREAAAAFQAEYDKEQNSVLAVALAEAKQAAGDVIGATAVLRDWQGSHPDDPAAAQALGMMELTDRNFDEAQRNLDIVLKAQPNNLIALNNLAWVLQQKGDKRAREYAQRAFEQSPTPEVVDTLAWILTTQGEASKALPLLQSAAIASPQNPSIKYHLAVALKDLDRGPEAVELLRPLVDGTSAFDEKPAAQSLLAELTKAKP